MGKNCQCESTPRAEWILMGGKNVPCWRCPTCDAFSGVMSKDEANTFRRHYFAVKNREKRHERGKEWRKAERPAPVLKDTPKSTTGTQLSLFKD